MLARIEAGEADNSRWYPDRLARNSVDGRTQSYICSILGDDQDAQIPDRPL